MQEVQKQKNNKLTGEKVAFKISKPHPSVAFLVLMLAYLLGVSLASLNFFIDYNLLFYLLAISLGAIIIFWQDWQIYLPASVIFSLIAGLAYPHFLGKERLVSLPNNFPLIDWLMRLRAGFEGSINHYLPSPHSQLASGLLIGIKSNFPKRLKEAFIATGTIHIVAISGFNVTIVIKIFSDWLRGLSRYVSFFLGTGAIILFVIIVGGQASVVRAGIMGWLFLLSRIINRQALMLNILLFSALIMVAQEPRIITDDIGFQLSFSAMLGLIYISPLLERGMARLRSNNSKFFLLIPDFLIAVFIETISAQLAVAPLLAHYFGRISPLSPIPNFLILPIIILPMGLGFLLGVFGIIIPPLATLIAVPLFLILDYQIKVVQFFSMVPFAQVYFRQPSLISTILIYVIMIITLFFFNKKFITARNKL